MKKVEKAFPYIVATLFAIITFDVCASRIYVYSLLMIIGYIAVAASLIFSAQTMKKSIIPVIGFGLLALASVTTISPHSVLDFVAFGSAATICQLFRKKEDVGKKFWFVPALIMFVNCVICLGTAWSHVSDLSDLKPYISTVTRYSLLQLLISPLALLGAVRWQCNLEGDMEFNIKKPVRQQKPTDSDAEEIYCDMMKHVLLLLFTCGVWMYMWIYKTTKHTNVVKGEEYRDPKNKLLLCLFVPFYSVYWTYKTAQRVDKIANKKGISSDMSTLCLILAIFVPIIPPILLQDKLNGIITANTSHADKIRSTPELEIADEMKKYKDLLDSGVITQEEFDAKKKQLLGL